MEEDIMILESECYYLEELGYLRENNHFIRFNQALKNLIKEFKKTKIENIEYKLGQTPDTTENYKTLKKELEKWKNGEM